MSAGDRSPDLETDLGPRPGPTINRVIFHSPSAFCVSSFNNVLAAGPAWLLISSFPPHRWKTWGWPLQCRPPRAPCQPSPRPSSAGQEAPWLPPTCRASWRWHTVLCATSPSPEQNPPPRVYLPLFNIYAYLNLIFKDKSRKEPWTLGSFLPPLSFILLLVAGRKSVPGTGRRIGKYHVLISMTAPWSGSVVGTGEEPQ